LSKLNTYIHIHILCGYIQENTILLPIFISFFQDRHCSRSLKEVRRLAQVAGGRGQASPLKHWKRDNT